MTTRQLTAIALGFLGIIWADGLAAIVYVALGIYLVKGGPFFLKLAEGSTGTSAT